MNLRNESEAAMIDPEIMGRLVERDREVAALRARVAIAEDALLTIFHDYEDDEIGKQPISTQYAFSLGKAIFNRDAGNKDSALSEGK